jgi:hypothetical protein
MGYQPVPAIQRRAPTEGRLLPSIGGAGTGGVESASFHRVRMGYQSFVVLEAFKAVEQPPFARMMQKVKDALVEP